MRGTGSTDYEIDDTFVPEERSSFLFHGQRFDDAPVFRLPTTFFGVALAAVALGIARGAIEAFVALAVEKRPVLSANTLAERTSAQHDLARAEAMVDSSRASLRDAVVQMWEKVLRGDEVDLAMRARVRRSQTFAAESAAAAVALLYRAAGGSALYESCPLERAFRDVNAALGHVTLQRGITEDAGRVRLGLKPLSPLF
jgi:alkylation response protein AidB-like acyl-CoA dehydrogenase